MIHVDLGRSASGSVTRAGFDRMVAEVCLGNVGAVAARDASRFARNSRDWQQLIEATSGPVRTAAKETRSQTSMAVIRRALP
ncbi:recombinase family protein [Aureimonas pseudogalii]|uniref:recombinase family protein n=1 Tax=Aureimonas pseudogalii TaxID=1744844 RepID=UPI0035E99263